MVSTTLQRKIARGMVEQVNRVNGHASGAKTGETIAEMRAMIIDLQTEMDRLQQENEGLRSQLITYQLAEDFQQIADQRKRRLKGGREVISLKEAALRVGCSIWTAWRHVSTYNLWEGYQLEDSNRWMVFVDQTFTMRKQANRAHKKASKAA